MTTKLHDVPRPNDFPEVRPFTINRLSPLGEQPTTDQLHALTYQCDRHNMTLQESPCGHMSRGGMHCAACVDAELLRRKVDVAIHAPMQGSKRTPVFSRDAAGRVRMEARR